LGGGTTFSSSEIADFKRKVDSRLQTDSWVAKIEKDIWDGTDSKIRPRPGQKIWVTILEREGKGDVDLEQQAPTPDRIVGPTGMTDAPPPPFKVPQDSKTLTCILEQMTMLEKWFLTEAERER
jgi:hypothetical protein